MRPEKNIIIDEIKTRVDRAPYVLLTDYTGMHVEQFNDLRNRLSGANAEFRVVKNNLLRRALQGSNLPDLETYLHGQSAVVIGDTDISAAAKVLKTFAGEFSAFEKAVKKITGQLDVLLAFFDFPVEHWVHLRTTNPIESTFSTVRLRTKVTRGAGSRKAGLAMAYKLLDAAQDRWRRINGHELVPLVRAGATFIDGKLQERSDTTTDADDTTGSVAA